MKKSRHNQKQIYFFNNDIRQCLYLIPIVFIGIFGFRFDALAGNCTFAVPGSVCPKPDSNITAIISCDSGCEYSECVHVTTPSDFSPPNHEFVNCSCSKCKAGYYKNRLNVAQYSSIFATACGNFAAMPPIWGCTKCAQGSYSNGADTSCTPCASNTYGGGGDSSSCKACPTNATCDGSGTFTCGAGYYKNGDTCTQCPLADDIYTSPARTSIYRARYTSTAGAKSINDCYLPSGRTYYDAKGTFTFDTTCNYE